MVQEILYTSAPRGLKPGSQDFCTVVSTSGMAATLAERLESLSGYRHVFAPHEANAPKNPIACSHLRLELGGKQLSVLSRIGAAGVDYSGRSNKLAHHVVLDVSEQPTGGPAWLLSQPGFMEMQWDGEVHILPQGRRVPSGDAAVGICCKWKEATGDAGWAGVLSQSFLDDPSRVAYIIYEVGTDPLPLVAEAFALLPVSKRWRATFSTYYTASGVPQLLVCNWRCVLRDSEEAKRARRTRDALVISLVDPMPPAESGPLVQRARTGIADVPTELTQDDESLGESARFGIDAGHEVPHDSSPSISA